MVSWNDLFTFVIMMIAILTYIDQQIYLPGQSGDVLSFIPSLTERMMFMVSWNDLFTFVIMMIAILTYIDQHGKHKK